jgi:hypothetical protein
MLKVNSEIVFREVDTQTVLVNANSGLYYSLNATGSFIFRLLREYEDHSEILQKLCDAFGVSEQEAQHDLNEFLREMSGERILLPPGE